jgi:hypothetical protein
MLAEKSALTYLYTPRRAFVLSTFVVGFNR